MYEKFYGFHERPFSLLPDPDFLYLGKNHRTALTMLEYGLMSQAGFTVITGEIGSGKTTLCRHLLNQVGDDVTIGLIANAQNSFDELLQWVLLAFGLSYKGKGKVELYQTFSEFLIEEYRNGRSTVLIIDEAQNLTIETLEELRMLSNINADKHQVLQMLLLGQPELRKTLRRPELEQFAQRISVDFHLDRLSEKEAGDYIHHRLKVAGGNPEIFDEGACRVAFVHSLGTPRLINRICDLALVYGFAEEKPLITAEIMHEVALDKAKAENAGGARLGLLDTADGSFEEPRQEVAHGGMGVVSAIPARNEPPSQSGELLAILQGDVFKILTSREPREMGYEGALWTHAIVRDLVWEQCGVKLNHSSTKQLLLKLGLEAHAQLKQMFSGRNKVELRAWLENDYPVIKEQAKRQGAEILFLDFAEIQWIAGRNTPVNSEEMTNLEAKNGEGRYTQYYAFDSNGDMVFLLKPGQPASNMLVDFVESLLIGRRKRLFLICGGGRIQSSSTVQAFVKVHCSRLQLFFLPPSTP